MSRYVKLRHKYVINLQLWGTLFWLDFAKKDNECQTFLIQSEVSCDKTNKADNSESVVTVCQDKQHIKETISIWFEKQLDQMLQDWLGKL